MNSFFKNTKGCILLLFAIVLMVLFLIGGIVIDTGNLYIKQGELQYLAKQSANTGIIVFSQILQNVADNNKKTTCYKIEKPPEVCISNNMFDFLSETEILNNVSSIDAQQQVVTASKNFIKNYDSQHTILDENIKVIFPDNFLGNEVKIRIQITFIPIQFFINLAEFTKKEVRIEAISLMRIF
jgi:hypothetical protein